MRIWRADPRSLVAAIFLLAVTLTGVFTTVGAAEKKTPTRTQPAIPPSQQWYTTFHRGLWARLQTPEKISRSDALFLSWVVDRLGCLDDSYSKEMARVVGPQLRTVIEKRPDLFLLVESSDPQNYGVKWCEGVTEFARRHGRMPLRSTTCDLLGIQCRSAEAGRVLYYWRQSVIQNRKYAEKGNPNSQVEMTLYRAEGRCAVYLGNRLLWQSPLYIESDKGSLPKSVTERDVYSRVPATRKVQSALEAATGKLYLDELWTSIAPLSGDPYLGPDGSARDLIWGYCQFLYGRDYLTNDCVTKYFRNPANRALLDCFASGDYPQIDTKGWLLAGKTDNSWEGELMTVAAKYFPGCAWVEEKKGPLKSQCRIYSWWDQRTKELLLRHGDAFAQLSYDCEFMDGRRQLVRLVLSPWRGAAVPAELQDELTAYLGRKPVTDEKGNAAWTLIEQAKP